MKYSGKRSGEICSLSIESEKEKGNYMSRNKRNSWLCGGKDRAAGERDEDFPQPESENTAKKTTHTTGIVIMTGKKRTPCWDLLWRDFSQLPLNFGKKKEGQI